MVEIAAAAGHGAGDEVRRQEVVGYNKGLGRRGAGPRRGAGSRRGRRGRDTVAASRGGAAPGGERP
jgi:hypothetical protein